ncbi:DedA family protein [Georgenia faecalis]|uniref:DedA family protein n=1 Tax=Georgenia faecalis TaxID=2483799 RepID=UPI0019D1464E|nr:VTT domain-containing protein [Georgenia faecalis]
MTVVMDLVTQAEELVLTLGASPWVLLAVLVLAMVDGFFPPVPSESVVIAAAVLATAGDGPPLLLLVPVAALGAFVGDTIAFAVGRRVPLDRVLRGRRGSRARVRAEAGLARRGTALIVGARFVPVGRVAVNLSAGALGFPARRFLATAGVAAVLWAGYSTALGVAASRLFALSPTLAVAAGVAGGILSGLVLDALVSAGQRWRVRRADAAGADAAGAGVPTAGPTAAPGSLARPTPAASWGSYPRGARGPVPPPRPCPAAAPPGPARR